MTEFKLVEKGKATISDEKKLKETGAIWNIEFSVDGNFKQNFNLGHLMKNGNRKWLM